MNDERIVDPRELRQSMVTDFEKDRLLRFIGYGRLDAPVWFLGMEEAGGGEDNLRIRATFEQVEDMYDAHRALGITKHHEGARVIQPQWGRMAELMLRLNGTPAPSRETRRSYQAERLGRSSGETLLLELMPIPKPRITEFNYPDTFPEYPTANLYYDDVLPMRIRLLRDLIAIHEPRILVAYGKAFWNHYLSLIEPEGTTLMRGFPVHHTDSTSMILIPFWTSRSMNGRLEDLAAVVMHQSDNLLLANAK